MFSLFALQPLIILFHQFCHQFSSFNQESIIIINCHPYNILWNSIFIKIFHQTISIRYITKCYRSIFTLFNYLSKIDVMSIILDSLINLCIKISEIRNLIISSFGIYTIILQICFREYMVYIP